MRKYQQQKILDLLQTMNKLQLAGLYADCREGALSVGRFIESIEGEKTQTAALLKEYCELLSKAGSGEIGEKVLRRHLIKIDNSVRSELRPNKIEVAFISYNASMSDSIESIYLAAKADPDCDAFWIPVPFFEKNNDGSFGVMHYDGADCYGENIESVDWREYDIETRHPDIIFTFSPYDAGNYVTSIHPDFYCERLRNFTDCLVYLPYFVAVDDVQEYFCTVAGCVFAHKVVLQSEKVRDTYIRVFKEKYGNRFGKPEEKFIAIGSPKYEKTLGTRREDCKLPAEWNELIGDKKAILYNTSITAMLKGNERYLKKLRAVLDTFRDCNSVVLWWRPHPLSEAVYKSMRPHLLEKYEQIVADYKREGWGIYDTTPDLHRAIACTDAYYGDRSSVVDLYKVTGKKIFFADYVDGREEYLCNSDFFFITMFVYQNALFSFTIDKNLMVKTDLETMNTGYFGSVPGKNPIGKKLYHHSVVAGDKVILVPFCANDIAVYDFRHGKYEIYPLDLEQKYMIEGEGNFYNICLHKNKWFLIPFTYRAIVAYNPETGETEHCLDLSELFPVEEDPLMFHQYEYLDDSTILIPALRSNKLLEFNLETYQYKVHRIGGQHYKLNSIHKYNGAYWIVCLNQLKILKWEYESNSITEFDDFPQGCTTRNSEKAYFNVRGIFLYKDRLICMPAYCNMAVEFHLDTGIIRKLDALDKCFELEPAYENVSCTDTCLLSGSLIYFLYGSRKVFCYDIESETVSEICDVPPLLSHSDIKKVNRDYVDAMVRGFLPESVVTDANALELSANVGKSIYDYIKKLILGRGR